MGLALVWQLRAGCGGRVVLGIATAAINFYLEAPSIGWQLFALDSSQGDKKALVLSLDTYGTRLLTEALSLPPDPIEL